MKKLSFFLTVSAIAVLCCLNQFLATDCPPGTVQQTTVLPDPFCPHTNAIVCINCGDISHPGATFSLLEINTTCGNNPDPNVYIPFITNYLLNNYPDLCSGTWQPCDPYGTSYSVIYIDFPICWQWLNYQTLKPCDDSRCLTEEVVCWNGGQLTVLNHIVTLLGNPGYDCKQNQWKPDLQLGTCFHIPTECSSSF
ncbi:MAG: hypothetical protein NT007_19185 [Candidatus Kapabacteria bacterium]|nr:hypothetical protein [Candidatus Kapabacteria bacterium]